MQNTNQVNEHLDRLLDASLAKYAAVEPRPELEERVLTRLRALKAEPFNRSWWHWGLAVAVTAVVLLAVTLIWKPVKPLPTVASGPNLTGSGQQIPHAESAPRLRPHSSVHKSTRHSVPPQPAIAKNPKLDTFPTPRPLSQQEQILASYVVQFRDHAVLVARARTEALHRDAEQMSEAADGNAR